MPPRVSRKRFNLRVDPWVKDEVRIMAAEINPERPMVQDVLEVAILIRRSDPRLWKMYVQRYLASKGRYS